jgi:putative ABC transport system ATP-binding protein
MEKLLKLENVSYSYQDGKEKNKILEHVSYSFEKGKIYAVVGASGSGKTTTLSLSSGLDKPDEGKVLFKGKDIQEIGLNKYRREDISIVFQSYNLIYYMNALENVMSALEIAGIKRKDKKEYCLSILEQLGLSKDECKRDIRQLSGGQQQRVSIGRALANKPSIILADEPTGNLDSKNSKEVLELLKYCAKKYNQTLILITHDINIAKSADRVITIEDGEIISDEVIK